MSNKYLKALAEEPFNSTAYSRCKKRNGGMEISKQDCQINQNFDTHPFNNGLLSWQMLRTAMRWHGFVVENRIQRKGKL